MAHITSKTGDRLMSRASELTAIADALDEAGFRAQADAVDKAAGLLARAGSDIKLSAERYDCAATAD